MTSAVTIAYIHLYSRQFNLQFTRRKQYQ